MANLDSTWFVKGKHASIQKIMDTAKTIKGYDNAYPVDNEFTVGDEVAVVIRLKKTPSEKLKDNHDKIIELDGVETVECHSTESTK